MMYAAHNIPHHMQRLRAERGLSLAQVGDMLGTSREFVWKLEADERTPSVARLLDIARAFGVTPNELLENPR